MNFKEMVQRAVNAEAKTGLRSSTMVQDLDICCPQGHRLSYNIFLKVLIQGTTTKEPRTKEFRPKKTKLTNGKTPAPPRSNEPTKPNCKKKKRE